MKLHYIRRANNATIYYRSEVNQLTNEFATINVLNRKKTVSKDGKSPEKKRLRYVVDNGTPRGSSGESGESEEEESEVEEEEEGSVEGLDEEAENVSHLMQFHNLGLKIGKVNKFSKKKVIYAVFNGISRFHFLLVF